MNSKNNTNDDFCVCCGEPVPEGRMVCRSCETGNTNIALQKSTKPAWGFENLFKRMKEFWNEP